MTDFAENSLVPPFSEPKIFRVEFKGSAMEFFKIWIVNLGLSIITLGIYSAWAKVRTRRYFYANTVIDGHGFDYHADPIKILKGRIVLAIFFIIYGAARVYPALFGVVFIGALLFPWLLVRGMIFNTSNSSYRGVRFGFDRDYKAAYKMYGLGILLTIVSFGILSVRWSLWMKRFAVPRTRYGQTYFSVEATTKDYDRIYIKAIGMYLGLLLGLGICLGGIGYLLKGSLGGGKGVAMMTTVVVLIVIYGAMAVVGTYIKASLMNFFWPRTMLADVRFKTQYRTFDLLLVYIQNAIACVFTLGLAFPWAMVELARYKASCMAVSARPEDFERFTQGSLGLAGATGEEVLDMWDIDLGF